jgi:hypothetical protein
MPRTLPERDPTIDALAPATRAVLAAIWTRRAASELGAGAAFAAVERDLVELGADPAVLALARRAVEDEPRHSELCRRLAEAYAGAPVDPAPDPGDVPMPRHPGADPALRRHLHVVAMCCINETIACGFVEACLAEATGPLLQAIHREHLADEIHHARVGWAHLGSRAVDAATRAAIAAWLPQVLDRCLRHWERRIRETLPADGVPGHALPPVDALIAAARAAVETVVLPGFDHVGVDTAAARAWFAAYDPAVARALSDLAPVGPTHLRSSDS